MGPTALPEIVTSASDLAGEKIPRMLAPVPCTPGAGDSGDLWPYRESVGAAGGRSVAGVPRRLANPGPFLPGRALAMRVAV
jgi:hypothetical protein